MAPVWSKEDSCGGNETLGLKKKANELLRIHEGKIPEGFQSRWVGMLHDIERQSTMQVLKKQVVIQLKSSNRHQWEHKSVSYPCYIYHRTQSERKLYQDWISMFYFANISAPSGISFIVSLPKTGFHSWLHREEIKGVHKVKSPPLVTVFLPVFRSSEPFFICVTNDSKMQFKKSKRKYTKNVG